MAEIVKLNDTSVAEVGTIEVQNIYGKTQLVEEKASLEARLAKINALLGVLNAPKEIA